MGKKIIYSAFEQLRRQSPAVESPMIRTVAARSLLAIALACVGCEDRVANSTFPLVAETNHDYRDAESRLKYKDMFPTTEPTVTPKFQK
jgi:hypothetical protein